MSVSFSPYGLSEYSMSNIWLTPSTRMPTRQSLFRSANGCPFWKIVDSTSKTAYCAILFDDDRVCIVRPHRKFQKDLLPYYYTPLPTICQSLLVFLICKWL